MRIIISIITVSLFITGCAAPPSHDLKDIYKQGGLVAYEQALASFIENSCYQIGKLGVTSTLIPTDQEDFEITRQCYYRTQDYISVLLSNGDLSKARPYVDQLELDAPITWTQAGKLPAVPNGACPLLISQTSQEIGGDVASSARRVSVSIPVYRYALARRNGSPVTRDLITRAYICTRTSSDADNLILAPDFVGPSLADIERTAGKNTRYEMERAEIEIFAKLRPIISAPPPLGAPEITRMTQRARNLQALVSAHIYCTSAKFPLYLCDALQLSVARTDALINNPAESIGR